MISSNKVSNYFWNEGEKQLIFLNIGYNQITSIDLSGLTNVTQFHCYLIL